MAERHTVDVDVVGSKPIRLPQQPLVWRLFFVEVAPLRDLGFEIHQDSSQISG